MSEWLQRLWYASGLKPGGWPLLPLSWIFATVVWLRRRAYRAGVLRIVSLPAPVIVIGNITVGGAGKTPLTAWVVERLRSVGLRPGIVSRGYGRTGHGLRQVTATSSADEAGDEPLMLAARLGCPVVVGGDRVAAAKRLLAAEAVDAVICDDGLQHYRLGRDAEIAVVDGRRGLGNGLLLPVGPLRESRSRLRTVDAVVYNGGGRTGERMLLEPGAARALDGERTRALGAFAGERVHAVAGIADPQRFFSMLEDRGLRVIAHAYPDHYRFRASDVRFDDGLAVLMTEKDAVKCRTWADQRHWFIPVEAKLEDGARGAVCRALSRALAARFPRQAQVLGDGA